MRNFKMENFLNFRYLAQMYLLFSEIVTVRINWQQDFLSSNSVCNHTRDWQIRLPLGGRPILLITRMITRSNVLAEAEEFPFPFICLISFFFSISDQYSVTKHFCVGPRSRHLKTDQKRLSGRLLKAFCFQR